MTNVVAFVDSIASSPTVRLDLNDGTSWTVSSDGTDLSPPPMRRTVVSTMLRDGEPITAGAYGNRTLTLSLDLIAATQDLAWTATQNLWRELNRPTNILKVQLGTVPVFFRTYRAPDSVLEMIAGRVEYQRITVQIPAEPFGRGLQETPSGSPFTVTNNPAAGSNGQFFDVTGVKGDVETPLRLTVPTADMPVVLAVRRRGTPSAAPFLLQAESMTLGADASLPGNDALMSGAGSNYARISMATPAHSLRLTRDPHPSSASVDARGTYRVFGRFRKSVAGDVVTAEIQYGPGTFQASAGIVTLTPNAFRLLDLGLVPIPSTAAPVYDSTGVEMSVQGVPIMLYLGRTSGTGNVDVDYLLFVPADDRLAVTAVSSAFLPNRVRLDAEQESVYGLTAAEVIDSSNCSFSLAGALPYVSPGVTNRIYYIENLGGAISATSVVTATYHPRYLLVPGS